MRNYLTNNKAHLATAGIRNSGFSAKSKVCAFKKKSVPNGK